MSVLQGEPPSPKFRSIFGGIALGILLLLAFLNLPILVKYTGAALTFLPGKLGLMQVVKSGEVLPVDMTTSPTAITFTKPGNYVLYTDNYDLLVINDAIAQQKEKAWFKINTKDGESIKITLLSRAMAIYDTPLAKGRPVALFTITSPGNYIMTHPARPTLAYIVPDYTSGRENWITFLILAEVVFLFIVIRDIRGAIRSRKMNKLPEITRKKLNVKLQTKNASQKERVFSGWKQFALIEPDTPGSGRVCRQYTNRFCIYPRAMLQMSVPN